MHKTGCTCGACRVDEFEMLSWRPGRALARAAPFSDSEEMALAMELLDVASEAELDQFLGKLFKGAWKGLKKVGAAIGKVAKPLGTVLKGIAKTALPMVGGALGSMIPIPGVGTALGSALGGAVAKALELEFGASAMAQQEIDVEMARRFVRIAGTSARALAHSDGRPAAVRGAVQQALRTHLPQLAWPGDSGRWQRRGHTIELSALPY